MLIPMYNSNEAIVISSTYPSLSIDKLCFSYVH